MDYLNWNDDELYLDYYCPLWIKADKCTVDYIVSAPKNAEIKRFYKISWFSEPYRGQITCWFWTNLHSPK